MINHDKIWHLFDGTINKYFTKDFSSVINRKSNWKWYDFFYKEIYACEFSNHNCVYEMRDCIINKDDIVVDFGANVGFFTNLAAKKCKKVISIEGSPELFSCLVKNTSEENKNIQYINANIISKNEHILNVWSENPSKVNLTIEDIFKINNLDKIDFLKIDIEGSEHYIFDDIDPNVLNRIDKIAIETHNDELNYKLKSIFANKNFFYFDWYLNDYKTTTYYFTKK